MNHYRATNKTDGTIVEYDAEFPRPDHLTDTWVLEDISVSSIAPDAPPSPPPAVQHASGDARRMNNYIVTLKATGAKVYRYGADAPVEWAGMEFATHDHTVFVDPVEPVVVPLQVSVKITKMAFRNRFTAAEKVGIEFAGLDNPAATMPARLMAASLRANQADIAAAQHIDLTRPDTRGGVESLEYFGLIAPGRAAVILDTAPTEQEVWNG